METSHFFINTKNLAVLLIDMQEGFINVVDPEEKEGLINNQIKIIQACKNKKIPLIVINYKYEGSMLFKLKKEIDSFSVHFVSKNCDDAFAGTNLLGLLKSIKAKKLLLMGISACYCVLETATSAVQNNFEVFTTNLLINGWRKDLKEKSLRWYKENCSYLENQLPFF